MTLQMLPSLAGSAVGLSSQGMIFGTLFVCRPDVILFLNVFCRYSEGFLQRRLDTTQLLAVVSGK